ncbi:MAG: DUF2914 domain-containing protein [Deferribacteraceae bacterium]|nr:DUF2914 domain-containing protein [Deferribacteraceae bacterium]
MKQTLLVLFIAIFALTACKKAAEPAASAEPVAEAEIVEEPIIGEVARFNFAAAIIDREPVTFQADNERGVLELIDKKGNPTFGLAFAYDIAKPADLIKDKDEESTIAEDGEESVSDDENDSDENEVDPAIIELLTKLGENRLYFFTELKEMSGQTMHHIWSKNGEEIYDYKTEAGSDRWRTYSYMRLANFKAGDEVHVAVVDDNGHVFAELSRVIGEADSAKMYVYEEGELTVEEQEPVTASYLAGIEETPIEMPDLDMFPAFFHDEAAEWNITVEYNLGELTNSKPFRYIRDLQKAGFTSVTDQEEKWIDWEDDEHGFTGKSLTAIYEKGNTIELAAGSHSEMDEIPYKLTFSLGVNKARSDTLAAIRNTVLAQEAFTVLSNSFDALSFNVHYIEPIPKAMIDSYITDLEAAGFSCIDSGCWLSFDGYGQGMTIFGGSYKFEFNNESFSWSIQYGVPG